VVKILKVGCPLQKPQRPGLDRLCRDAQRGKFDLVAAWSIDRLGRSLADLLNTLSLFDACHIDLYLDRQAIDISMPMGRLVFQVIGAFGEFERSMIRERVIAGMKRAVAAGKRVGRPTTDAALLAQAKAELMKGTGILKTARLVGIGVGTVQKLKNEMRGQMQACPSALKSDKIAYAACETTPATPSPTSLLAVSQCVQSLSNHQEIMIVNSTRMGIEHREFYGGRVQRLIEIEGACGLVVDDVVVGIVCVVGMGRRVEGTNV
jgi:DNA invertase Pin-like site-specific DNA recombinase